VDCGADTDSTGNDEIGGITLNGDWNVLRDVEVSSANDNCVKVNGMHNLVDRVVAHNCQDAGIQVSAGSENPGSGTNNTVRNCDSYLNNDTQCNGENADGFAIKEGTGTGNTFEGCRAWDNADDGWDLYAWTSPVTIRNSWALQQCRTTEGSNSDGNGFKLGGDGVSAAHVLSDLIAADNNGGSNGSGFTTNNNPASMSCSGNCAAWGNTEDVDSNDSVGGVSTGSALASSDAMINAQRAADGSLPDVNSL
jgi:pectate disaccharide-lyase